MKHIILIHSKILCNMPLFFCCFDHRYIQLHHNLPNYPTTNVIDAKTASTNHNEGCETNFSNDLDATTPTTCQLDASTTAINDETIATSVSDPTITITNGSDTTNATTNERVTTISSTNEPDAV